MMHLYKYPTSKKYIFPKGSSFLFFFNMPVFRQRLGTTTINAGWPLFPLK